jgi:glycosyltransferase involved in cell wall biosynthesis
VQPALKIFEGKLVTKKKTLTLVYTGNAGKLHRLDLFLEALKHTDANVQFYCIGHGSQTQTLKHLTKQYALEARVKFIPFLPVEQLAKYVDDADVCLVSLVASGIIGKTIPQKLVQYLAWGKPILAMLDGDGANLLQKTQGGFIVKPQVKAIVNAIEKLQALSSLQRQKLGQRNRDYYQQNLQVDIAAKTIEHHCTDLIKLNKSKPTTLASK